MSHKYRVSIGRESSRPASRGITTQLEPRRISRDPSGGKSVFCLLFHARKSRWLPGIRQKGAADLSADIPARQACGASGRTAKTSTRSRGCPRPCTLARAPKYTKRPFPVHPAALINEPPAHHRERQVAAKGGMLQTRSRPQSCGFRPPVLAAIAKRRCAPGVGQPTCGAPDAAEPVERKPLPPHAAGVRKSAFFR